jgi:hypothetical protein
VGLGCGGLLEVLVNVISICVLLMTTLLLLVDRVQPRVPLPAEIS